MNIGFVVMPKEIRRKERKTELNKRRVYALDRERGEKRKSRRIQLKSDLFRVKLEKGQIVEALFLRFTVLKFPWPTVLITK